MSRIRRIRRDRFVVLRQSTLEAVGLAYAFAPERRYASTVVRDALALSLSLYRRRVKRTVDVAEVVATFGWDEATVRRSMARLEEAGLLRDGVPQLPEPSGMAFKIGRARLREGISPLQLLAMARIERAPGAWRQYGAFVEVAAQHLASALLCGLRTARRLLVELGTRRFERTHTNGRAALLRVRADAEVKARPPCPPPAAADPPRDADAAPTGPPSTAPPPMDTLRQFMDASRAGLQAARTP